LKQLIQELKQKNVDMNPVLGEVYSIRAFFALSKPIDGECPYQSGYLDVKLIVGSEDSFMGEIQTELPVGFALKKNSQIKIKLENLIYKPDYSLLNKHK